MYILLLQHRVYWPLVFEHYEAKSFVVWQSVQSWSSIRLDSIRDSIRTEISDSQVPPYTYGRSTKLSQVRRSNSATIVCSDTERVIDQRQRRNTIALLTGGALGCMTGTSESRGSRRDTAVDSSDPYRETLTALVTINENLISP